jgi:hypothetical protein
MSAGIACAHVCSKIWRLSARPPTGKLAPQQSAHGVPTAVVPSSAVGSSHATSKLTVVKTSRSRAATATAPSAGKVIFPLDKQLALLPGLFTPLLQNHLAHLGTWMPFAKAATLLECFTHTHLSEASVQRYTESVGLAYEAVQLAEVERIERDWPEVEEGPAKLLVSADGAMVPLLGGEWSEVKTVVVSEVGEVSEADGTSAVWTHNHSYFSRLCDALTFQRLSLGELTRRCLEKASQIAAVNDGAEWIQGFVDYHCPEAVRILDFAHAAERICQIGDVVLGEGSAATLRWREEHLHALKHRGASDLLASLRTFAASHLSVPQVEENLAYLEKRIAQMQYPFFQAALWPIGSGVVESGNKLVVEARLKGAGMHWSRASVNPMLSLRNAVCNDRWEEAWQQSAQHIERRGRRWRPKVPRNQAQEEQHDSAAPRSLEEPTSTEPESSSRPAASHPWKRPFSPARAQAMYAQRRART